MSEEVTTRTCKACSHEGPETGFGRYKLKGVFRHYNICIECVRASQRKRNKKHRDANRDKVRRNAAIDAWHKYNNDPEHRKKVQERNRKRRANKTEAEKELRRVKRREKYASMSPEEKEKLLADKRLYRSGRKKAAA